MKFTEFLEQAKKKTFWDWIIPNPSLQFGAGIGLIHKQFDIYAGAGLSWDINFNPDD